ncbi:MAG: glycosyltransferase family 2 protein [Cytophagales bacterium]|nr:glycosyltransferase family 2 protein [Bernardetiaceae bacterium]MDW8210557.1 glycosyltransferase family 2 protein [Cytophagales bacterium]
MPYISIVSPVYKAENILVQLVKRIDLSVSQITDDYEIILVEDGSPDKSWKVIEELAKTNKHIRGFKLSRNFGQHHAITCGLDHARGEWIVVMDCDLQDQPEEIISLYRKAQEGYDIVFGIRHERKDTFTKKFFSKLYYKLYSILSDLKIDNRVANFGIYHKKVITAVSMLREPIRGFLPHVYWVGFKKTGIEVKHSNRFEGKSSYTFSKLFNLALNGAINYSDKPLKIAVVFGILISIFSGIGIILFLVEYFLGKIQEPGFASLIISLYMLCGIIIFFMGIIGLYLSKVFEAVKNRPLYIIDKTIDSSTQTYDFRKLSDKTKTS